MRRTWPGEVPRLAPHEQQLLVRTRENPQQTGFSREKPLGPLLLAAASTVPSPTDLRAKRLQVAQVGSNSDILGVVLQDITFVPYHSISAVHPGPS